MFIQKAKNTYSTHLSEFPEQAAMFAFAEQWQVPLTL